MLGQTSPLLKKKIRPNVSIEIRKAEVKDMDSIRQLFSNCIMTVCKNDYSSNQLKAWASATDDIEIWYEKIQSQIFVVAEQEQLIVGLGSIANNDLLDLVYVHADFQRRGIARRILNTLLSEVQVNRVSVVNAHVSKTARAFFESRGFTLVREQSVSRRGVSLVNYIMTKAL